MMTEKYILNGDDVPTIPAPHDCKISCFKECEEYLVIEFCDDLNTHDSIRQTYPKAKKLTMRFHLVDDYSIYKWQLKVSLLKGEGYILMDNRKFLEKTPRMRLEYLFHWVTFNGIIIQLYPYHILSLTCDYVEMIWDE